MQIYNFLGINSQKVMTFWDLIPEKLRFLNVVSFDGTRIICVRCLSLFKKIEQASIIEQEMP